MRNSRYSLILTLSFIFAVFVALMFFPDRAIAGCGECAEAEGRTIWFCCDPPDSDICTGVPDGASWGYCESPEFFRSGTEEWTSYMVCPSGQRVPLTTCNTYTGGAACPAGNLCQCVQQGQGPCPSGDGGDDYSSSCTLYPKAGDDLQVDFSIGLEGDYDAYVFNYGDGVIDCSGSPCSIYDKPDWPNFNHTYASAGGYTATIDLYYGGSWTGSCADNFNVFEATCPGPKKNTCQIRNLDCPEEALINSAFNVTYEFLQPEDPDSEWPHVNRQGWRASTREWCVEGDELDPSCWYAEQKQLSCPPTVGTYNFSVQCDVIDPAFGSGCDYDSFDDRQTCDVECVDSLTPCTPDSDQVCCDNAASNVDATATKGSAPGSTCGGASCYLPPARFPEASPPNNQSRCCGDDTNEFFISGTSDQSCDGTSACCDSSTDYVSGGQCRTACNQPPASPVITPRSSSQAPQALEGRKTKLIGSGYKVNPEDYVAFRRPRPASEPDPVVPAYIQRISGSILNAFKRMFGLD